MRALVILLFIVTQVWTVNANVEKTIFLGPSPVTLLHVSPGLDDLNLPVLSPVKTILPTQLPVRFPDKSLPRGLDSWYLLRGLEAGRRYEVRLCWPATQPTDFWLDTYTVTHVFETPDLIQSLAEHSQQRQSSRVHDQAVNEQDDSDLVQSVLFLRVQAAAAYYSANRTLMDHPLPVDVDIILDPFLLNIFPQSLGPVAVYITVVAVGAWFLSDYIYRLLLANAAATGGKPHTD